jgi:hypothetical protein
LMGTPEFMGLIIMFGGSPSFPVQCETVGRKIRKAPVSCLDLIEKNGH